MSKKSNLRKSLIASALSLTLSASMLVGTTFAWFTDSVTSTGNKIQAGTLDIDLYKIEADGKEVEITESKEAVFNYNLWEPGYSDAVVLKVANNGTLALKYRLDVVLTSAVGDADITDVIEVWSTTPSTTAIAYPTSFDGYTYRGTLTEMMAEDDGAIHGTLTSEAVGYQGIILKMSEEAGNEYQGAIAEFDIRLNATQYAFETDGFGNNGYDEITNLNQDKNGNYTISNAAELTFFADEVNRGNTYKDETVVLTADIDLGGVDWTPIGKTFNVYEFKGNFDGQNHTVSNFNVTSKAGAALFGFVRGGKDTVIENLTVENVVANGGDYVAGIVGQLYATIENCHAINVSATATPFLLDSGKYDGGAKAGGVVGWMESGSIYTATNCTATDVVIKAYRDLGGVIGMAHNNNVITDCKTYGAFLQYVNMPVGGEYDGNKVNENIGEVIGRRGSNVVESGTYFEDVIIASLDTASGLGWNGNSANHKSVYYVTNADELRKVASYFVGQTHTGEGNVVTIELLNDIDLAGSAWDAWLVQWITFNGNNHTISNVTTEGWKTGFFGYVGGVTINDLTLENVTSTGAQAGTFIGSSDGVKINNSYLKGSNYVTYKEYVGTLNGAPYTEEWGGIGAISGILQYPNYINVEITAGTTVTLKKDGLTTQATYKNDLTGYIEENLGTIVNNGSVLTSSSWKTVEWVDGDVVLDGGVAEQYEEILFKGGSLTIRNVTFEKGLTIYTEGNVKTGKVTLENCTIKLNDGTGNGGFTQYEADFGLKIGAINPNVEYEFKGCTFTAKEGHTYTNTKNSYNVYIGGNYDAKSIVFDDCTFEKSGKHAIGCSYGSYGYEGEYYDLTIKGCNFKDWNNNTTAFSNGAAIRGNVTAEVLAVRTITVSGNTFGNNNGSTQNNVAIDGWTWDGN